MKLKLLLILSLVCLPLAAQKGKTRRTAEPPKPSAVELYRSYRFAEMLEREGHDFDSLRTCAEVGQSLLGATQRAFLLDSMQVPASDVLRYVHLSGDAGRVGKLSSICSLRLPQGMQTGEAAFLTELGDRVLFSATTENDGRKRIYSSLRIAGEWTAPTPLDLGEDVADPDYPFLLPDGVTLYFSAAGTKSVGGADLFVTRFNAETQTYFAPENVGFPYSSIGTDLFFYVDEILGIGYFATDRAASQGRLTLYTFEPREKTYLTADDAAPSDSLLIAAAQIRPFKAYQVLPSLLSTNVKAINPNAVQYVINDRTVYTSLAEFRNAKARATAQRWKETLDNYRTTAAALNLMRAQFAQNPRSEQRAAILQTEQEVAQLRAAAVRLAKQFRQEEN